MMFSFDSSDMDCVRFLKNPESGTQNGERESRHRPNGTMTQTGERALDQKEERAGVERDRIRQFQWAGQGRGECDAGPGSFGRFHGWEG
jgi:hypothetical protein